MFAIEWRRCSSTTGFQSICIVMCQAWVQPFRRYVCAVRLRRRRLVHLMRAALRLPHQIHLITPEYMPSVSRLGSHWASAYCSRYVRILINESGTASDLNILYFKFYSFYSLLCRRLMNIEFWFVRCALWLGKMTWQSHSDGTTNALRTVIE